MALHIHTQSRFNNYTAHRLYRILIIATSVMGVMKIGNVITRAGITSLAFRVSVLPLHHIRSLMSPLYPCLPVYSAACLRGQCRLLQYVFTTNISYVSYVFEATLIQANVRHNSNDQLNLS